MLKTAIAFLLLILSLTSCNSQEKKSQTSSVMIRSDTSSLPTTEDEWKERLTPQQFSILREKGTDRPFTGKYYKTNDKGVYHCAGCGSELFTSDMKFDSDCGWPSFDKAMEGGKIITKEDRSFGMTRTEILCAKCGGHLGHLFDDGPTETGLRYCVNSTSLNFVKKK